MTILVLRRRPSDVVAPARERPNDGLGADRVGAVHEDRPNVERPPAEGRLFHEVHHWHDGLVTTEIMVEPEFVNEPVAVPDGRATFEYVDELRDGEHHVISRRIGGHEIFKDA